MRPYRVHETFYMLQGEGANAGRPAVFVRFAGCNLWTGRERDRARAVCRFCDTEFVGIVGEGGGAFGTPADLARHAASFWPTSDGGAQPFVVLTGGEPLLQADETLLAALHAALPGVFIAAETNGTISAPDGLDWITLSPKAGARLALAACDELKVVWPQGGLDLDALEALGAPRCYLQPMDGPALAENIALCVRACLQRPRWWLSLQTHKLLGLR